MDKNNAKDDKTDGVAQRLLDAGEELFSEIGFDSASTRKLTELAGCNLAAVNYYFGGKHQLYTEVVRRRMAVLRDKRIAAINSAVEEKGDALTLEELIRVFANAFVEPLIQDAGGRRFLKILSWEMLSPKFPKEEFVKEMINLTMHVMTESLIKLCPNLTEKKAALCINSMVAQLMHSIEIDEALSEVKGYMITSFTLQQRIDHTVEFSVAAIQSLNDRVQ